MWQDCRVRVVLKSPGVEALCAVPIRLPRCVAGTKWGLQLWRAGRGDCREFLERASPPKVRARSSFTYAMGLINFAHFIVNAA